MQSKLDAMGSLKEIEEAVQKLSAAELAAFRAWFARSPRRLELVGGFGGLSIAAVGASFLASGRRD